MNSRNAEELEAFPRYKANWLRWLGRLIEDAKRDGRPCRFKTAEEYYAWWTSQKALVSENQMKFEDEQEGEKHMTDIEYIASRHTEGDLLCQLAEEAAELAQAALKLRRAITQNNPTPVTAADAKAALIEEIADVEVAFEVLRHKIGITCDDVFAVEDAKIERWKGRIENGV